MLAAWMRLKYPHISIGALASSAPILQFEDIVPPYTFYDIVSNDFKVSIYSFPSTWMNGGIVTCFTLLSFLIPAYNLFQRESLSCFKAIKESWDALESQGMDNDGLLKLSRDFHLCR